MPLTSNQVENVGQSGVESLGGFPLTQQQQRHQAFKSMLNIFHQFLLYSIRRPESTDPEAARHVLWGEICELKRLEDATNSISFPSIVDLENHIQQFVAIFRRLKRLRVFYNDTLNFLESIPEPEITNPQTEFEVQQQIRTIVANSHYILVAPRVATSVPSIPPPLYPNAVNNPPNTASNAPQDGRLYHGEISQLRDGNTDIISHESERIPDKRSEITQNSTKNDKLLRNYSQDDRFKTNVYDGDTPLCPLHSVALVDQPHIRDDVCVCVGILYPNREFHCRTSGECSVVKVPPEDMQKLGSKITETRLYSVYLIPAVAYHQSGRIALLTLDKKKYMLLGRDLGAPPSVNGLRSAVAFAARYGVPKSDRANARKKKNVDIHYYYMFKRIWETQSKEKNPKSMAITTKEGRYRCYVCFKEFTSSENCNRHARSHAGDQIFVCDFCHTSFTRFDALQRHYEHNRCRPEECQIVCRHCSRQFFNSKSLEKHMESVKEAEGEVFKEPSRKKMARG